MDEEITSEEQGYSGSPLESLARVFLPGGTVGPMAEVWMDKTKNIEARAWAFAMGVGFEAVKTGIVGYYAYLHIIQPVIQTIYR